MFDKLIIRNFQSHQKSILTFHEGVNVIIGQSDSGKTAIIRALRWLIWNRPGGDSFRSTWGGKTQVSLSMDENKIVRLKDNASNEYYLNETLFKAFGTDTPEDIQAALNVDSINLQSQLDAPFLLSESPGSIASHFNKVAHLDQIDTSLKKVQSWLNEINRKTVSAEEDIETLKAEMETYKYLDKMEIDIEVLEEMDTRYWNLSNRYIKLDRLRIDIVNTEAAIQTYNERIKPEQAVDAILALYDEVKLKSNSLITINSSINEVMSIKSKITAANELLLIEDDVNGILSLMEKANAVKLKQIPLDKLINDIGQTKDDYLRKVTYQEKCIMEFTESMPEICPLCEQPIPHIHDKN